MHILFLTDNFPPESNAPATRTYEHAKVWVGQGHEVTVITCAPNFPEGRVYDGYKNKWFSRDEMGGIRVCRVKSYITANAGVTKRILDFASFMITGALAGLFVRRPDVVVATSPQFFTALAGWFVGWVRRRPFVFELRDIWPASLDAVGIGMSRGLFKTFETLEMFLYRRAALIVSVTHAFKAELEARGIDGGKIEVVRNGTVLEAFSAAAPDAFEVPAALQGKFIAGYVGTHGMAHALDKVLDCAEQLKDDPNIGFMLVGGGSEKQALEREITARGLDNVVSLPRQERAKMPAILKACDVTLVTLRDSEVFRQVIPSKIFESMAAGRGMVLSMPQGEATDLVQREKAGSICSPEDPDGMAEMIKKLSGDAARVQSLGGNGLAAAKKYDRRNLALDMLGHLEKLKK